MELARRVFSDSVVSNARVRVFKGRGVVVSNYNNICRCGSSCLGLGLGGNILILVNGGFSVLACRGNIVAIGKRVSSIRFSL